MIATMPFQSLMAQPERVSIGRGNYCCPLGVVPPFDVAKLNHPPHRPRGSLQVIEAHIDIVLREVAVVRDNVGPRAGQERHGHLADSKIEVLDAAAVAAHVQRVEVVDLNVLAAVVSFACPELRVRLALKHVPGLHEGFPQAELIVTEPFGKFA